MVESLEDRTNWKLRWADLIPWGGLVDYLDREPMGYSREGYIEERDITNKRTRRIIFLTTYSLITTSTGAVLLGELVTRLVR